MRRGLPQDAHKHSHKSLGHRDATRLTRKAGTYYYRRRLPGGLPGEVALSLSTDGFRRAEWLAGVLEAQFQKLPWHAMTPSEIQALLKGLLDRLLEDDRMRRVEMRERGKPVFASRFDLDEQGGDLQEADRAAFKADARFWRDVLDEGDFDAVFETVDELVEGRVVTQDERRVLSVGVLETFIKAREVSEGRSSGAAFSVLAMEPGPSLPPPPLVSPDVSTFPTTTTVTLNAAPVLNDTTEPFFTKRLAGGASHHDTSQDRTTLRLFKEVCGDRPVNAYRRGDITGFLDTMRRMPKHYGKSPRDRDRSITDIIAEADAAGAERISDKTVKRHLTALSQFFAYVRDSGHITGTELSELVAGHRFKEQRKARKQRDAWEPDELTKLFLSPMWTGCAGENRWSTPGPHIIRNARFWLPLLALFHGGRLEELADLYRRDVWCDEGTWAIRITESEDNGDAGDRTLKTEAAERVLPLHPELIRLGFLTYVERTAPKPDDPLFPDLEPQGPDKKRGPRITRWFVNYRRSIGVFRAGVSMHAFRHTAITRLTDAIETFQQKRHRDYLMGHAGAGTEGDVRYDKGPGLKACAATLALLRYPEIDLSHLYVVEAA